MSTDIHNIYVLMHHPEWIVRPGVAMILGAIIGALCGLRRSEAGWRTTGIVAGAAAAFTVISQLAAFGTTADVTRIMAQVVSGVSWLPAAVIFTLGGSKRGVTTGVTMFMVTAIGMACGIGWELLFAPALTVLTLGMLAMRRFARHSEGPQISVALLPKGDPATVIEALRKIGIVVRAFEAGETLVLSDLTVPRNVTRQTVLMALAPLREHVGGAGMHGIRDAAPARQAKQVHPPCACVAQGRTRGPQSGGGRRGAAQSGGNASQSARTASRGGQTTSHVRNTTSQGRRTTSQGEQTALQSGGAASPQRAGGASPQSGGAASPRGNRRKSRKRN